MIDPLIMTMPARLEAVEAAGGGYIPYYSLYLCHRHHGLPRPQIMFSQRLVKKAFEMNELWLFDNEGGGHAHAENAETIDR